MKIAVASGKGGTGKTTVSVNLYHFINRFWQNALLVDCDVEEPNDALFLNKIEQTAQKEVFQPVPEIDTGLCTFCKKCVDWCAFNAITVVSKLKFAEVDSALCHSCGACSYACHFGAIKEHSGLLGSITKYSNGNGGGLHEGRLKIGSAMQTLLIKKLKKDTPEDCGLIIYDAPPGTSCPVVETVADADFVLLVTEPTPFGLHDLKITIELIRRLKIPFGVFINKAGLGNNTIYQYLKENNIELMGEMPFNKNYAATYATGNLLGSVSKETENIYRQLIQTLKQKLDN